MSVHVPKTILVVDDEPEIRTALTLYLSSEGFMVETAANGTDMKRSLVGGNIDLVLLDLGLKNESGLDLLKNTVSKLSVAVVILTGKSDPIERVVGLEMGADDFIVKPFLNRELLARINAVLRRTQQRPADAEIITAAKARQIRVNGWLLDMQSRQFQTEDGTLIDLTGIEFDLLAAMASNVGEPMSRNELSQSTLNRAWEPNDRSLDIHIHNLRRKLSQSKNMEDTIVTVRNIGYLLAAEVVSI